MDIKLPMCTIVHYVVKNHERLGERKKVFKKSSVNLLLPLCGPLFFKPFAIAYC